MRDEVMRNLVDFICLLCHEARNVRHPIKAGKIPRESKYIRLINLPHNRYSAWLVMAKARDKAARAERAEDAVRVFQEEYGLNLKELLELYHYPCWKHSACGGNKWASICSKISDLVEALDSGDDILSAQLLEALPRMEHNTGILERKLQDLKNGCDVATS